MMKSVILQIFSAYGLRTEDLSFVFRDGSAPSALDCTAGVAPALQLRMKSKDADDVLSSMEKQQRVVQEVEDQQRIWDQIRAQNAQEKSDAQFAANLEKNEIREHEQRQLEKQIQEARDAALAAQMQDQNDFITAKTRLQPTADLNEPSESEKKESDDDETAAKTPPEEDTTDSFANAMDMSRPDKLTLATARVEFYLKLSNVLRLVESMTRREKVAALEAREAANKKRHQARADFIADSMKIYQMQQKTEAAKAVTRGLRGFLSPLGDQMGAVTGATDVVGNGLNAIRMFD